MFNLTNRQKEFLYKKQLNKGDMTILPPFGFNFYVSEIGHGEYFDANPFTRKLSHEPIIILSVGKERSKVKFVYGDKACFWLNNSELSRRYFSEKAFLLIVLLPIFIIYNVFMGFLGKGAQTR